MKNSPVSALIEEPILVENRIKFENQYKLDLLQQIKENNLKKQQEKEKENDIKEN